MDKLIYLIYPLLGVILFWGCKVYGKEEWNEGAFSISQMKAIQGFTALLIMLHHTGQKTCAPWHPPQYIVHGLDLFVPFGYYFVGIFLFCSGYGLYKSYRTKPDYLKGYFGRRVLPVILSFYSTGLIFLIVRYLLREKMDGFDVLFYVTGLKLCNPNTWFVIALPFLYLGFYLAFRFCKKEGTALTVLCAWVFMYVWIGTIVDHNDWWMRGEWWYNSIHFFLIGIFFAKYEERLLPKIKKHYILWMLLLFVGMFVLRRYAVFATNFFSYYGENFNAPHKVLRRWASLTSEIMASCSFVFFVFLLGMKIRFGNRFLQFMGGITLEFYLIHGLFVELFGYNFADATHSLYYIRNVALMTVVVFVPSVPAAILLQRFHKFLVGKLTGHS